MGTTASFAGPARSGMVLGLLLFAAGTIILTQSGMTNLLGEVGTTSQGLEATRAPRRPAGNDRRSQAAERRLIRIRPGSASPSSPVRRNSNGPARPPQGADHEPRSRRECSVARPLRFQ